MIILTSTLVIAYITGQESLVGAARRAQAILLAEEGLEVSRNIRDSNFSDLTGGTHGVASSSNQWAFSGSQDITSMFTRQVAVSIIDANRKSATSTVTWQQTPSRTGTVSLGTRFTNWLGTKKGTAPSLVACFNLDVPNSDNEAADGISIATQGNYLYLGRQNNSGYEFFVFDVTTPASPTLLGKVATGDTTNDIAIKGNYAYIASSDDSGELTVVDISNPSVPTVAIKFNLTAANSGDANADALAVAVDTSNNNLYLTRVSTGGKEFYVFNISTPTAPTLTGSIDLKGDIKEVGIIGTYVYGASSDNSQEFQVINVTTPATPSLVASLDLDEGATQPNALSIAVATSSNIIYLGRDGSAAPEFYIIDVTNPLSPSINSTLDIGTHILQSMDYDDTLKYVFFANTAPGADDYQVIDVTNPLSPVLLNNLNLNGTPYKLVYSVTKDAVMIASGYDSCELQIIAP